MGENNENMNGSPYGGYPNGASQYGSQYAGQYGQQNQQYGGQYDQQYAGQYSQQNQQYGGQYSQQNQQYAGQYSQQNQQYAGQYGQQNQQYAGQYSQQNQQYAGQYGQQNQQYAGQYGQQTGDPNTYNQTMNVFGDQSHRPESPNKRKGIKIAIIAAVAALVAIAVFVVVYFVFLKKTPKETVNTALENTVNEVENGKLSGLIGLDKYDLNNVEFDSKFKIDLIAGVMQYSDIEVEFNGCAALDDGNAVKLGGAFGMGGEKVSAELTVIDNKIYVAVPELLTKTLVMDTDTIMSELNSSAAGAGGTLDAQALEKILDNNFKPALEKFKDSIVCEKIGKEEFENANGDTVKAQHYTVKITVASLTELANAIVDCMNEYIDSNISADMLSQMGVTKEQLKQMAASVPSVVGAVFTKDIESDVYVNDGKVVRIDASYDIAVAGIKCDFTLDLMGEDDVTSDIKMVAKASYASTVSAVIDYSSKSNNAGEVSKNDTVCKITVTTGDDSIEMIAKSDFSYSEETGDVDGSAEMSVDSDTIKLTYSGNISDVKAGEHCNIDDIKIKGNINGQEVISMTGSMGVASGKQTITAPADAVDYSVLQDEDAQKYINMDKLQALMGAWGIY